MDACVFEIKTFSTHLKKEKMEDEGKRSHRKYLNGDIFQNCHCVKDEERGGVGWIMHLNM